MVLLHGVHKQVMSEVKYQQRERCSSDAWKEEKERRLNFDNTSFVRKRLGRPHSTADESSLGKEQAEWLYHSACLHQGVYAHSCPFLIFRKRKGR